jgi:hypothetical protein
MEGEEKGIECATRKTGFGSPVSHVRVNNLHTWFFFHDSQGNFLSPNLKQEGYPGWKQRRSRTDQIHNLKSMLP